jgi:hypothetical protein
MTGLYCTPPSGEHFNHLKEKAIELWKEIDTDDDKYGYATSKINRIKNLVNVANNFMYIVAMFDIYNQCKLADKLTTFTRFEISQRLIDANTPIEYNVF